jgi:hypothetical protein
MGSVYNDARDDWTRSGEKRADEATASQADGAFFFKAAAGLIAMEACGAAK